MSFLELLGSVATPKDSATFIFSLVFSGHHALVPIITSTKLLLVAWLILFCARVSLSMVENPEWTVIYHGAGSFKGRGEFLRLMLEDKGIRYKNSATDMYGPNGTMLAFRGSHEAIESESDIASFPLFFPPAIKHQPPNGGEAVLINQVPACLIYLGECLGYNAQTPQERARANCILMNAIDYIAEGRVSFHPVKNHMSYHNQVEEGDRVSKEFSQTRMLLWLHYFEKVLCHTNPENPESPIAGGSGVTYADFALFHVLDATCHQFDTDFYERAWTKANTPKLKQYYEWMRSRPNLQAYFASDRCPPYQGNSMM